MPPPQWLREIWWVLQGPEWGRGRGQAPDSCQRPGGRGWAVLETSAALDLANGEVLFEIASRMSDMSSLILISSVG